MSVLPVELSVGLTAGPVVELVVEAISADAVVVAAGHWRLKEVSLGGVLGELLDGVGAVASAVRIKPSGGLVAVDSCGEMVHAPLVGPSSATDPDAGWLTGRLPGRTADWLAAVGAVPTADWMLAKLSWLHRTDAPAWTAMTAAWTPAAWLVWSLTGRAVTVEADAAATGCWNAGGWRFDLLALVDGERDWTAAMPAVVSEGVVVGSWRSAPLVIG